MFDAAQLDRDVRAAALAGLTTHPKTLPPKLFYDAEGVRLFGAITRAPEYYPTRTEMALLAAHAAAIAALAPQGAALIEYGASDETKALTLLDAPGGKFAAFVPIDVAADALADLKARLALSHPALTVTPVCGDFLARLDVPEAVHALPRFGFFPGSTIGNLEPHAAQGFLALARNALGPDAWFIVGTDLRKDPARLVAAYDDAAGITAEFNLNVLRRLNREAGADFDLDTFRHRALWNAAESRIEMHLVSTQRQRVHIAGHVIQFEPGETIHTENSYKYDPAGFAALAAQSGWRREHLWTDPESLFAIHALCAC